MTTSEMIALVKARLHRASASESDILGELQAVQRELERRPQLPWFLLAKDTSLATVAGTRTVAVPTGFLREQEEAQALWYIPGGGEADVPLGKDEYDVLYTAYQEDEGEPEAYALKNNLLYIFPLPDAVYTLHFWCYKAESVLDTGTVTSNDWSATVPDLVVAKAGMNIALNYRDHEAVPIFSSMYKEALSSLVVEHYQRKEAARAAFMGEGKDNG